MDTSNKMDKIVALAKRRGFFYPGSDLYGGLANTYDYGPMGAELLRNIKNLWWNTFVTKRADMVGLDASIISHHRIWEASGHVASFADAMVDCKNCKLRIRADHLIEDWIENNKNLRSKVEKGENLTKEELDMAFDSSKVEGWTVEKYDEFIKIFEVNCPNCKKNVWTPVRKFNQLFPVQLGLVEGEGGAGYLRGETAQGMFVNFQNVVNSTRVRLPFGIAQIGKSFRNEITPGNSIFRTIEFEQGEIEYFFDPTKTAWEPLFESWKEVMWEFVTQNLGISSENLRWRPHTDEERSFYSMRTEDLEYQFPFGTKELWGLAYRTNYDLSKHQEFSRKDLSITDPHSGEKILPHVIEPAVGINRLMLAAIVDSYFEDENRIVLKLPAKLSPIKAAVFPLLPNKPELVEKAREVLEMLQDSINGKIQWDDRGNIGKRYLAQDEVGTPFCITIDFTTLEDRAVTVRNRDDASQERVEIENLTKYLQEKLS
ncbi:MAG TPA: glycine--tRNA ligase [Patescibacteria group bacterium]